MISDYALSGWIANLGVVPLFLFAAFLFFPLFLSFCLLLVLVCVVLELICLSLSYFNYFNYREIFLSIFHPVVKIFLTILLCTSNSYAQKQDLFLSKGEQIELKVLPLKHFSVGNKEVIKYKYLPKRNKILIKGKGQGFSDLITWNKQGIKTNYHIYVTSKREQLKKMEIAQILKGTGLKTQISGDIIYVSGELISLSSYLIIKNLAQKKLPNLIFNITLRKDLKNTIIAKVYNELYSRGVDYVACHNSYAQIICSYQAISPPKDILKKLTKVYHIHFQNMDHKNNFKNYRVEFKIVSLETNEIGLRNSGFNKIENNLAELLSTHKTNLSSDNILLEDQDMSVKLLATPEIKTTLDKAFQLELGGEIPFNEVQDDRQGISWKFVGLKVNGKITLSGKQFLLQHSSKITKPSKNGIAGPKGKSSVFIPLDKFFTLYSVQLEQDAKSTSSIPYLKKIPFLNNLFAKQNNNLTHRKVVVMAKLIEVNI